MVRACDLLCGDTQVTSDLKVNILLQTRIMVPLRDSSVLRIWTSDQYPASSICHDIALLNHSMDDLKRMEDLYVFHEELVHGDYVYVMIGSDHMSALEMLPIICNVTRNKVKHVLWFRTSIVVIMKKHGACHNWGL